VAFRIRNDLVLARFPKKFLGNWEPHSYWLEAPCRFELSFAPEELPEVCAGVVRFVELVQRKELIWRWP
jgi:hypothetical protein